MRLAVILCVAVLGGGLLAGPAQAGGTLTRLQDELRPGGGSFAGPAFAGGGLSWVTVGHDSYHLTVARGARTLVQEVNGVTQGSKFMALAASSNVVAFGLYVEDCHGYSGCKYGYYEQDDTRVVAGPIGGPLVFRGCAAYENASVDVSGEVVAYLDDCARGATVRDLSPGAGGSWRTFPAVYGARIAGPYLAVDARTGGELPNGTYPMEIRVYDWRSGELVYRVDAPSDYAPTFDIAEDGTLVYDRVAGVHKTVEGEIAWASPASPSPHRIRDGFAYWIRIAGDRVAIGGRDATSDDSQTRVVDLAGTELAVANGFYRFDFDGRRLTWATQPCEVTAVVTWDLRGTPPALSGAPCPMAKPVRLVARLDRRRLRFTFACPKRPALGCAGTTSITLPNRSRSYKSVFYLLGPGERGTFRSSRLTRATACGVARSRGRASVYLYVESQRLEDAPSRRLKLELKRVGKPRGCGATF